MRPLIRCAALILVVLPVAALGIASPVLAQTTAPPPAAPQRLGAPEEKKTSDEAKFSVKHHVSFMASGGWDLDVLGGLTYGVVGTRNNNPIVIEPTTYTDVYVHTPMSEQVTVGFGVFSTLEVIAHVSQARYRSSLAEVGTESPQVSALMTMKMSDFHERTVAIGLRKYFASGPSCRRYVNLLYGHEKIDALSAVFTAEPPSTDPNVGNLRIYNASTVPTIIMEFGVTFERPHYGMFVQAGARYQKKLSRFDDDLAQFQLQDANKTGIRLYIPLQFGVLFRL
jgi:hypothetical protein